MDISAKVLWKNEMRAKHAVEMVWMKVRRVIRRSRVRRAIVFFVSDGGGGGGGGSGYIRMK